MNTARLGVTTDLKNQNTKEAQKAKADLLHFVRNQFKQLTKRNLKIPVQLYHL